jgi:hypothetical protein
MNERFPHDPLSVESLMAEVADEFTERLHRGERPDVEEYVRRFPQIAFFIRQMFPALLLMHQSAVPDQESAGAPGDGNAGGSS